MAGKSGGIGTELSSGGYDYYNENSAPFTPPGWDRIGVDALGGLA